MSSKAQYSSECDLYNGGEAEDRLILKKLRRAASFLLSGKWKYTFLLTRAHHGKEPKY